MDIKKYSSNSLSFIGDAVYTLHVREFFIENKYQQSNKLQYLCNKFNSAKGQMKVFDYLNEKGIVGTIRRELGSDIDAACGQLRRKVMGGKPGIGETL